MDDTTIDDLGGYPNGEEAVSKAVAPQGVEGSNPLPSASKKKLKSVFDKPENSIFDKGEPLYKLHLYRPDGTLRADVSKAAFTELARRYGDLVRCVPSHRWATMDEICTQVWEFEKKSYLKSFTRTRREIEDGIGVMAELGAVIVKN